MPAMAGDWTDAYYGPLYYDTAADLLGPELSAREAAFIDALLGLPRGARVLDLACGHGRHLAQLRARGLRVTGLDRSLPYLKAARASGAGGLVCGDVRALPFAAAFDGLYSWYASLFMWDDVTNAACLAEAVRTLRPGGRLLVQHANPLYLAARPEERAWRQLPDGGRVVETSRFDVASGVDVCERRLERASGEILAATARLRYYTPEEWSELAPRVGLRLERICSISYGGDGPQELDPDAPDLVAIAARE
jgi:SAM-dependent methyltransferase